MTEVSVVVCTLNRADWLEEALRSLKKQTLNPSQYEVIVVDNGSTDRTPRYLSRIQETEWGDRLVVVSEPRPGLAIARNTGFEKSSGEVVGFLDDDAWASEEWLERVLMHFESSPNQVASLGGRILPRYEVPKPSWFKDEYERLSFGSEIRQLADGESFSGSNMFFPRSVLERYGLFDERVGMSGVNLGLAEETSLFERIWQDCGRKTEMRYDPQLVVYHRVPSYKMRVSYRLKRAFACGQSAARRNRPSSLRKRLSALKRGSRNLFELQRAAFLERGGYPDVRNWLVEKGVPISSQTGELLAHLGLSVTFRQG